jgi:hypothetical protein
MPRESPHRPAVLTGHDRGMALIHHGPSHVPSRERIGHALDGHELIDRKPVEAVVLDREQPGKRVGAPAGALDDCGRGNLLTRLEHHPGRTDRDDVDTQPCLDRQGGAGLLDDRPGGFSHV